MNETVLVVDDDLLIRELVDITLTQAGYRVITASSGVTALELFRRTKIDAVLLDLHMPRMDGLAVLASMNRLARPRPPVLIMTADSGEDRVREASRLGCTGYLVKPFPPESLCTRVQTAIQMHRQRLSN